MHKFRKLGFIEYNGHLEVHNSLLSMVLNEACPELGGVPTPHNVPSAKPRSWPSYP